MNVAVTEALRNDALSAARRAYCLTLLFNIQGNPADIFDLTNQTGGGYAAGQIIWCAPRACSASSCWHNVVLQN